MSEGLETFVRLHEQQLRSNSIPESLWSILSAKVAAQIFDSGNAFQLATLEAEDESASASTVLIVKEGISIPACSDIWLIDHAWSFRVRQCRTQLKGTPGLLRRVATMVGVPSSHGTDDAAVADEEFVSAVYTALWKHLRYYRLFNQQTNAMDEECVWYLLDEVGTAAAQLGGTVDSLETPNVRIAPLLLAGAAAGEPSLTVSVMWPVVDLEDGDFVSVDEFPRDEAGDETQIHSVRHVIRRTLFDDDAPEFKLACQARREKLHGGLRDISASKFDESPTCVAPSAALPLPLKVCTDSKLVLTHLSDPDFKFVDVADDADVLFILHQHNIRLHFPAAAFVSEFPQEAWFVNKGSMYTTMVQAYGERILYKGIDDSVPTSGRWLPLSYNVEDSLAEFVGEHSIRAAKGSDNLWIVKPHALARSMDMAVSDTLPMLLRVSETGQKLLSKYIANPCLFRGRKFDMRFIVLVRDFGLPKPTCSVYDEFWIRLAPIEFSLDNFEEYQKHWTLMGYKFPNQVTQLKCRDFAAEIDQTYGAGRWSGINADIRKMLIEAFTAIAIRTRRDPAMADYSTTQRNGAVYGIDVMVDSAFNPILLEITYSPDCTRACQYVPSFYNDVFRYLFLGDHGTRCIPL